MKTVEKDTPLNKDQKVDSILKNYIRTLKTNRFF